MRNPVALALAAALVATVLLSNWVVQEYGVVDVAFGLYAPAAVYVVGLALILRDRLQRVAGLPLTLTAIAAGAVLSFFVAPSFALASGVAFGVSELADTAVYTPLRSRGYVAMLASNVVSAVVDSLIFLSIAFGSLAFLQGQVVGKLLATCVAVALIAAWDESRRTAVA